MPSLLQSRLAVASLALLTACSTTDPLEESFTIEFNLDEADPITGEPDDRRLWMVGGQAGIQMILPYPPGQFISVEYFLGDCTGQADLSGNGPCVPVNSFNTVGSSDNPINHNGFVLEEGPHTIRIVNWGPGPVSGSLMVNFTG
ncbi:MAG: hypothetical protein OEN56_10165 [Gemmatimonadota bacterium]|nr:hypothetical protein [Gemmatimonadota bacterium]